MYASFEVMTSCRPVFLAMVKNISKRSKFRAEKSAITNPREFSTALRQLAYTSFSVVSWSPSLPARVPSMINACALFALLIKLSRSPFSWPLVLKSPVYAMDAESDFIIYATAPYIEWLTLYASISNGNESSSWQHNFPEDNFFLGLALAEGFSAMNVWSPSGGSQGQARSLLIYSPELSAFKSIPSPSRFLMDI